MLFSFDKFLFFPILKPPTNWDWGLGLEIFPLPPTSAFFVLIMDFIGLIGFNHAYFLWCSLPIFERYYNNMKNIAISPSLYKNFKHYLYILIDQTLKKLSFVAFTIKIQ